ncbi:MAG: hypothetical protein EOP09_00405 [Proteobacteria bacterium]|nr:MAG: hypothetical protein EOP09_00405 [Pseudomonadota bacterium]
MRLLVPKSLLILVCLMACKDKGKVASEDNLISAALPSAGDFDAIYMLPESASLSAGRSVNFEVLGLLPYDNSKILNDLGTWTVSNPEILEVVDYPQGRIRALKAGEADVVFTFGEVTQTAHVVIADKTLDQLKPSLDTLTLDVENVAGVVVPFAASLVLHGLYSDGSVEDLSPDATWTCADPSLLACDGNGKFRALAIGTTDVTVKVLELVKTIPVTIVTHDPTFTTFQVTPSPLVIEKNTPKPFVISALYSNGQTEDITPSVALSWSNSSLIQVVGTSSKTVTGVTLGSGTVTLSWNSHDSTLAFKVIDPLVSVLTLESPVRNFNFAKGETERFYAKLTYNDGTVEDVSSLVSFESSDLTLINFEAGATYGTFQSLKAGTGILTARLGSMYTAHTITVSDARLLAIELSSVDSGPLGLNLTRTFVAKGRYSDDSLIIITTTSNWTIEDLGGNGAIVSNGVVRGTTQGNIRVKATFMGVTGSANLAVGAAVPLSIEIRPIPVMGSIYTVSRGSGNTQLTAWVTYSDSTVINRTTEVNWSYVIIGENFSFAGYVKNNTGEKGLLVPLANGYFRADATLSGVTGSRVIGVTP